MGTATLAVFFLLLCVTLGHALGVKKKSRDSNILKSRFIHDIKNLDIILSLLKCGMYNLNCGFQILGIIINQAREMAYEF